MNTKHYLNSAIQAFFASMLIVAVLGLSYFLVEPKVGQAVVGNPFTIKQTITDEISFLVQAPNVVMSGSLSGLTGGTANGSTTAVVRTNDPDGYTMTIAFTNNGTDNAMIGDTTLSESIHDYVSSSTTVPDFNFSSASTSAVFAYTVGADVDTDIDNSFLDDGAACDPGSGQGYTADRCWMGPSTTGFQIINRADEAPTGATSTIYFRVHVPNSPTPGLPADTYTATATLTALNK